MKCKHSWQLVDLEKYTKPVDLSKTFHICKKCSTIRETTESLFKYTSPSKGGIPIYREVKRK